MRYCRTIIFILRNIFSCLKLKKIKKATVNENIMILPMTCKYLHDVSYIYSKLSNGYTLSRRNKILFFLCGSKLVFILYDKFEQKVIGTEFYYFNEKDIQESTIHKGFFGILPEYQGRGLGTLLTNHAYNTYLMTGLKGVSSRVSCNNFPSLISHKKIGFESVEKYFDSEMHEERYYMICHLKNKEV